ncbi:VOC family protein [Hoeflea prorocentri]|uniref:VOC family protein n=1 Tax=Hoeflea prorocentri TaxID=1922333 RepID=A0A9X3UNJ6_9HYPH|nr:VOC family protein [Hoeflea prorocentri]MCY6382326.1 VOC family protein [Hoeflea prorocentri]MDA5400126.1 VOC family protein [Hoeflea prorocentri]
MIGVALVKIPVSDVNRSVAFYEKALDLTVLFVAEEYGWAQFEASGMGLALYVPGKGGGERPIGGSVDFHLHHSDLDALLDGMPAEATDAGIHENADGSRSLEFSDPDANLIKIMESR